MSDEKQPATWAMDYVLNKKRRRCDCLSCVAIEASALEASAVGEVMRAAAAFIEAEQKWDAYVADDGLRSSGGGELHDAIQITYKNLESAVAALARASSLRAKG